jgi:tellurium resistance protein TerD
MGISLTKGGNVNLSKAEPGLTTVMIGLGWDARATDGEGFDLDSSLFLLAEVPGPKYKVRSDADFIYYNNLRSACGAVEHTGDNRTGAGDGDDEAIKVDLSKVPEDVAKLAVVVTIHDAETRRQNFGMVGSAFIRVVNQANDHEVVRYDLSEDASTETAMVFGELYRHSGEWKFRAVGQGYAGGLAASARDYGVNLG